MNTFAVIWFVNLIHSLRYPLILEYVCGDIHFSLNAFVVNTFAVIIENICCDVWIVYWIHMVWYPLFNEIVCCDSHCKLKTFVIIFIDPWIHLLCYSLNVYALIFIIHWNCMLWYSLILEYICSHGYCTFAAKDNSHWKRIIDGLGLIRLFFWFPERCFCASSVVHVVSVQ